MNAPSHVVLGPISRQLIGQIVFLLLFIAILLGCFLILQPYLHAIIMAGLLASICFPIYTAMLKKTRNRRSIAAFLACTIVALLVIVPLTVLSISMVSKGIDATQEAEEWIKTNNLQELLRKRTVPTSAVSAAAPVPTASVESLEAVDSLLDTAPSNMHISGSQPDASAGLQTTSTLQGPPSPKAPGLKPVASSPLATNADHADGAQKSSAVSPVVPGSTTSVAAAAGATAVTSPSGSVPNVLEKGHTKVEHFLSDKGLQWMVELQQRYFPWQTPEGDGLQDTLLNLAKDAISGLRDNVKPIITNVLDLALNFVIMLFAMFYFFRDGETWLNKLLEVSPLSESHGMMLLKRIKDVARGAIVGTLLTAVAQGGLGMVGFAVVGIPWLFWGVVMGITSLVPVVGTAVVWVPCVLYLFVTGKVGAGIFLLIWCIVAVGLADNLLRPLLMAGDTGLSSSILFFAILGGVELFGVVGVIYGPLIFGMCAVMLIIWDLETGEDAADHDGVDPGGAGAPATPFADHDHGQDPAGEASAAPGTGAKPDAGSSGAGAAIPTPG